ncbi:MAG: hypothetical protein KA170_07510 [Candidatus Promineofilum sp.]|nr:hypothetical protein [Promineifilum sp.]
MQVAEPQTTTGLSRLEQLIRLYEMGHASSYLDRVLDKVFAQQAIDDEALLTQLRADLDDFEAKYEMDSASFYARFRAGEMGDAMDFMEWASLYDMHEGAIQRLSVLKS